MQAQIGGWIADFGQGRIECLVQVGRIQRRATCQYCKVKKHFQQESDVPVHIPPQVVSFEQRAAGLRTELGYELYLHS